MFTKIPPAAAGGSFSPKLPRTPKILRNPAGGSRWDSRAFLAPCRPGLNDPPAAAGGIPESQNLCRNFSCSVCATRYDQFTPERMSHGESLGSKRYHRVHARGVTRGKITSQ